MPDCKHMETRCNCGAHQNSPDCCGREVDFCKLREELCDYGGSYDDTQDCWRYQERDAADCRALAEELGWAIHRFQALVCDGYNCVTHGSQCPNLAACTFKEAWEKVSDAWDAVKGAAE